MIVDDGDAGFSAPGWSVISGGSYAGFYGSDMTYKYGVVSTPARWSATLPAGTYRVSVTWIPQPYWSSNAAFSVLNGTGDVLTTRTLNEHLPPDDFSADGAWWEDAGTVTLSADGNLVVSLAGGSDGENLVADAVRFERVS